MSTPTQTPLSGGRQPAPFAPGGGYRNPSLNFPPSPGRQSSKGWLLWLVLVPLLLMGLTYLLGRTVESFRVRLVKIPLAGKLLFAEPVWPILWNKGAAVQAKPPVATGKDNVLTPGKQVPENLSQLEAEIAARLAAVQVRETAVKQNEAAVKERENALRPRESSVADQEAKLAQAIKTNDQLRIQLQGQIRAEQAQVEVIRNTKSAAVAQQFAAMDDAEAIRLLKYMDAGEVAKILSTMDSYRAVRILLNLREVAPPTNTP